MNKLNKELFNKVKESVVVIEDNRVSDDKLLELIIIDFDKVSSKNGMLKLLRNNRVSVSMNRCFKMYELVVKNKNKEVK